MEGKLPIGRDNLMKQDKTIIHNELRPAYDLKNLQVRKFGPARKQFGNFIKLEPDIAEAFPDAVAVNKALRFLIQVPKKTARYRLAQATVLNTQHQIIIVAKFPNLALQKSVAFFSYLSYNK